MIARHWTTARAMTVAGLLMLALGASTGSAQIRRFFGRAAQPPGPGGEVNLPYMFNDSSGNMWRIYNTGMMQQQGNTPVYSQGALITVAGNQPSQPNNQGRLDEKTGELILDNMQAGNVTLTRRVLFDKDENMIRYIDIFHNGQNAEQVVALSIQSNLNFGVTSAQFVADPKHKDQNIGWVAMTGGGAAAVEMYAGKGSKIVPALSWPQGNNFVQATLSLTVPAGKDVALMHLHKVVPTQEAGVQFCTALKESAIIKSIPPAIRRMIVNFPSGQGWIGDIELLRGDLLDVVELRSGDQFRGTLKEAAFDLQTFYGPVNVPVETVVGIINVGQFRPRQLLVTVDGQIFGGRLKKETLDLQLSSGQITQIPLAQVSRVGYRKRSGEPEEWTFERPMVQMRTGERMLIALPTTALDVTTRYGKLSLKPESVAAISFQNEENGVHEIFLSDGSKFAGLLAAGDLDVTLETGHQPVKFPASAVAKLQFSGKITEPDDLSPTIRLLNDDTLVGTITGKLSLETAFDTIAITASEVRSMTRAKETVQDVTISLWDGTSLSGQLHEGELNCNLKSGITMTVPMVLLDEYVQPQPQPSPSMMEKITGIVADLGAEDWKKRDRAQAALLSMGPVAASALKDLRPKQPPEAQKGIDIVLQKLEEQRKKEKGPVGAAGANPAIMNKD